MDSERGRSILIGVLAFVLGWAIGLFLFGWQLWPVEYIGARAKDLADTHQQTYLYAMADLYDLQPNSDRMLQTFSDWPDADEAICKLYSDTADPSEALRLNNLAQVLNGSGCSEVVVETDTGEATGGPSKLGTIFLICGLVAVLALVFVAILVVWQRRSRSAAGDTGTGRAGMGLDGAYLEQAPGEQQAIPLARFQTTYTRGHDAYDESFSIENADGDFLGECGVGLSETLGADVPKNVTAFEVWLFDKNDIRTVTKVVMSDHAFFDEAIKAKLAPKGEPVLARPNETIVLETATLIVNASLTELEYGTGALPPQSFFERFTVELSAWNKEGEYEEPDIQRRVDDMLDF
jgi:hypothetical protein